MATRKGTNVFGNYIVHHILYAFFIYYGVCVVKKVEGLDRIVFYIVFKLNDHPTRSFCFGLRRIHPNGGKFELNFKKKQI